MNTRDFDRFMAERGEEKMEIVILGRACEVPRELPWSYMLKVERLLRTGEPIPGEENIALVKRILKPEDYAYVTNHPSFRASWFWELIAWAWLRGDEPREERGFRTEDDLRVARTRAARPKEESAR